MITVIQENTGWIVDAFQNGATHSCTLSDLSTNTGYGQSREWYSSKNKSVLRFAD